MYLYIIIKIFDYTFVLLCQLVTSYTIQELKLNFVEYIPKRWPIIFIELTLVMGFIMINHLFLLVPQSSLLYKNGDLSLNFLGLNLK